MYTVELGYTLRQNATTHFANILLDTKIYSSVLHFTIYLNNTYYETPESITFQLEDDERFTSYFNLSSGSAIETMFFNTSNPDHTVDQLKVSNSIIYVNEAPVGDYQTQLIVTVRNRAETGNLPLEDMENSTIAITVTKRMCTIANTH